MRQRRSGCCAVEPSLVPGVSSPSVALVRYAVLGSSCQLLSWTRVQHRADDCSCRPELTERETEILGLAARPGQRWCPRRLVVSPKTVHNHASNMITKLHVSDRSGAILRARDAGLGGPWVGLNYPCSWCQEARVPSSMIIDDECARCH